MMSDHELTIARPDPWGPCTAACSVCGPLKGSFQTAAAAHEHHAVRAGQANAVAMAAICRGRSLRGRVV